MIRNYFRIALRVFRKEKTYSLINISGLVLGFTCCLMISLYIKDEMSYDKFHHDGDRIFRVASAYMRQGVWEPYSTNSWPTAEKIKTNFGEVEQLVRIRHRQDIVAFEDKKFVEQRLATVDENFFDVFSFSLISGNRNEGLKGANKVILTESTAKKYFGDADPMGKILEINDGEFQLQISGVMEDMPLNSHFHFDFLISGQTARNINGERMFTNVGWDSQYVYIKMKESTDPSIMESMFPAFVDIHLAPFTSGNFKLFLQPLLDIHLESNNGLELEANGKISHIYIFSIIAIFILVIACVNYMNLTTARSLRRSGEVGMRKVLGASRGNLIGQFLSESFIMTSVAVIIAFGLTFLILPTFNQFAGKEITSAILLDPLVLMTLLILLLVVSLLSGAYPSFVLSSYKPLNSLKGGQTTDIFGFTFRKSLVILQFVIAIGLIVGTSIVYKQLEFLKNKELGINKELLISVPLQTMDRSQLEAFNNELLTQPAILRTGVSNMKMPGWIFNSTSYKAQDIPIDQDARKTMKLITVNHDFLSTVEAEIIKGRDFSKEFPSDINSSIILNESALEQLGWEDPIDKWIQVGENDNKKYHVVGVVKDFHFESLHRKISPTIFILSNNWLNWDYIKIDKQNKAATINNIKTVYSRFVTNRDFSYSFVNEDIAQQYKVEEKFTEIFTLFTLLAIILACIGTFGLISFSAERKSKEIGIRKILGASVSNVTLLLIKEFVILLLIASLISWPITYYFMNDWIDNFVYRIDIGLEAFVFATLLAMIITVSTTVFRALKAALENPIKALKTE